MTSNWCPFCGDYKACYGRCQSKGNTMYAIDITTYTVSTDSETTTTLYHSDMCSAIELAYAREKEIGVNGYVYVQYQSTDSSPFVGLERSHWPDYV